ncbi:MAG TPA: P-II family nitrogen regulator [Clostridiales bacterium]|nr:P-II family nitrogen regulator [Clostridiales bacterium]
MTDKAILAIVERGKAEFIVEKAKEAGAEGATIVYGRGTGEKEFQKFFNLHIESSKEIILIVTDSNKAEPIQEAIIKAGHLDKPGTGIVFMVSIENLFGLKHREEIDM